MVHLHICPKQNVVGCKDTRTSVFPNLKLLSLSLLAVATLVRSSRQPKFDLAQRRVHPSPAPPPRNVVSTRLSSVLHGVNSSLPSLLPCPIHLLCVQRWVSPITPYPFPPPIIIPTSFYPRERAVTWNKKAFLLSKDSEMTVVCDASLKTAHF